ncbi:jg25125 [Pararge aegeria aegeria]|uniref:Jg25125 protein n=1 Tax=Pararge aegeria aegeria TaxID=348720 RepID=A0A8S4SDQ1_9NEOP|nr:jg25125 [Pararge aegeria aegeria]
MGFGRIRMAPNVGLARDTASASLGSRLNTAGCARLDPGNPTPQHPLQFGSQKNHIRNLSLSLSFNDHPLSLKSEILVNARGSASNEAVRLSNAARGADL